MTDETDREKMERVREFLQDEMAGHKKAGNDSEVEELHDLLIDLESVMESLT